jgi:hypothetical protein
MIFYSLHKSEFLGQAYYGSGNASLFLVTIFEYAKESGKPYEFLRQIYYVEIHEWLHLLMKKHGIKGSHSEKIVRRLTDEIGDSLLTKELVIELTSIFSDVLGELWGNKQ